MPKNDIDYSNCVIYKICCKDPSITYEYYGHTTNKTKRKQHHKYRYNDNKYNNMLLYKTIRENDGWENWDFLVIEEYPCENVNEAKLRERYWIELKQSQLNCSIPSRTIQEYQKDNREIIIEYQKQYKEQNREMINKKQSEKITCECGSIVSRVNLGRHQETKKHKDLIA